MSPLFNVPFNDFGGLDLTNAGDESGGALDILNVDLSQPGKIQTRQGYTTWATPSNGVKWIQALPYGGDASYVFLADDAHKVAAYQGGLLAGSLSAAGSADYTAFAHVGTPTAETIYAFNSTAAETKKWSGSTWSNVSITNGGLAALSPTDNRLVVNGTTSNPSRVLFSDPGAPETFGVNNYVDLEPGTSGAVTALATWQNFVFAFKNDRFYVFYGTSTDGSGNPIFNYRTVYANVGPGSRWGVAVAPEGVYFVDSKNGVFLTTGGLPASVRGLDRLWRGVSPGPYFSGFTTGRQGFQGFSLSYANQQLFLSGMVDSNTTLGQPYKYGSLVFDVPSQTWSYYVAATQGESFYRVVPVAGGLISDGPDPPVFMFQPGDARRNATASLGKLTGSTDGGVAFSGKYRSSFIPFDWRGRNLRSGISGVDKIVRESMVDGTGTISYTLSNQWTQPANLPAGRTLTLGTAPQVAQARDRKAQKGRMFSWQVSGTAPWTVEKVTLALHGYENAGLKETTN